MKNWIKIAIDIVIIVCVIGASAAITILSENLKSKTEVCAELKKRSDEQSRVIDSLLARRMTVFDVQMHIQDKSKFSIYGSHNKGTINVPNERTYTLEVDSINMKIK